VRRSIRAIQFSPPPGFRVREDAQPKANQTGTFFCTRHKTGKLNDPGAVSLSCLPAFLSYFSGTRGNPTPTSISKVQPVASHSQQNAPLSPTEKIERLTIATALLPPGRGPFPSVKGTPAQGKRAPTAEQRRFSRGKMPLTTKNAKRSTVWKRFSAGNKPIFRDRIPLTEEKKRQAARKTLFWRGERKKLPLHEIRDAVNVP
jgi:hypothetical protein